MKLATTLFLVAWSAATLAEISPVRVVDNDGAVKDCMFVGQITVSNGLFQTKPASRLLQQALREVADAGGDTAIVRKSAHSGVLVDGFKCRAAPAPDN